MTDELLSKLKHLGRLKSLSGYSHAAQIACREAAKEIEKLRAQAVEDSIVIGRLNGKEEFQDLMKLNNRLREVLLEVRQFINDAPLGDEAHGVLATIDATVR